MLGFLHTAAAHVATFDDLVRAELDAPPRVHRVAADLLAAARDAGAVPPALAAEITAALRRLRRDGARLAVCTCSTLGGAAEAADAGLPVLRIDRPMAERAVALGARIGIVAALASTLAPTAALLHDAARGAGRRITCVDALCDDAWPLFEGGDLDAYHAAVAAAAEALAPRCDVVVLAQGSMAAAAGRVRAATPVLSSPRLGVAAALAAYRALPAA